MFAEERQQKIAELVASNGRANVTVLAERFNITTETVRRDLAALEAAGSVRRVHGGAVAADRFTTTEESITARTVQRPDQKLRIAQAALKLVPNNAAGSVLLDAGTTTEVLASLLAQQRSGPGNTTNTNTSTSNGASNPTDSNTELVVITHALPIAAKLSSTPGIALQLLGGRVRGLTQAAVGQSTAEAAARLRPDVAFLGTNGIHASFGLSTPDPEEAAVKAAFVHSARRIVVLADSSKLDAETLVQFASLKDLDTVITDSEPSPELAAALADAGVDVVIA
ncbi:DeoR/GlpR family DNA-binding transcription regulator [Pseudarthrobacter sp. J75]|uniref:DeoR/GlpR family DNA-binding transcription regulator n=1 Tax=unclassified Pseudarthrobacter TaxID=2647000 RepID=UPI002E813B89|nr:MULTISPECIES: DeoR/GlpR family DNA-binding transcription regulator [unclassified Pseudarthrobacter]MEE2523570.1 DeoR/GlpR family DNA-binding transcription regulator [Pseudarthrobacter sp. J47]MEE2530552.1 DeoR/GlpR family DNA-binding transcription regulator [Pseudarthrobacter sp. J75]